MTLRQLDGQIGDAERVTGGRRVALLDGGDRGGDESLEQALDRFVEKVVLDRDGGLAGQGAHQVDGVFVERNDFVGNRLRGEFRGRAVALAVDQLQDADDLADVIRHREDQHRLGQIADLSSNERLIEYSASPGKVVGIVDDQRLAGHGHVSGQTVCA